MVFSTFILAVADILSLVINIYIWIVIIAAIITWVQPNPYNPIVQILERLTNPLYAKIRRFIPTSIAGLDIAPILVILVLKFIDLFAIKLLYIYAQ